jgi:hypothetical protein
MTNKPQLQQKQPRPIRVAAMQTNPTWGTAGVGEQVEKLDPWVPSVGCEIELQPLQRTKTRITT